MGVREGSKRIEISHLLVAVLTFTISIPSFEIFFRYIVHSLPMVFRFAFFSLPSYHTSTKCLGDAGWGSVVHGIRFDRL